MSNIHLCELSGRSYVDPISNYSHLDIFDLGGELSDILRTGILPDYLYLQLIHELEHHRDMNSLVGHALAILWLRASDDTGERSRDDKLCDFAKILAFHHFMRPWFEGKALFAQFDAFPGPSEVLSLRSQNIFGYFIPTETMDWKTKTMNDMVDPVSQFLINCRTNRDAVDLKADLLISGTDFKDGGYFTGYLACRRFASICQASSLIARDSDFTIDYLHHFLLRDWYLAEVLLTECLSPEGAVRSVADYIINRLAFIESKSFRQLIATELRGYEKATSNPAPTPDDVFSLGKGELGSFFADPNTSMRAFNVYQDWLQWGLNRGRDAAALLSPRPFFRLGSAQGSLSIDEAGYLTMDCVDEIGPWKIGSHTNLGPRGTIASEMNLMLVPSLSSQFINFTSQGQFVWADLPNHLQGRRAERIIQTMTFETVSQQESIQHRSNTLATTIVESGEFLKDIVLEHRTRVGQSFNSFATRHILHSGHQLSNSTAVQLHESGLWGVLGRDPVAIKTLAFLGLLGSCSSDATRKPAVRDGDLHRFASRVGADVRPDYLEELGSRASSSGLNLLKTWLDRHWSRL